MFSTISLDAQSGYFTEKGLPITMKIRHALVASVAAASLVLASCSNSESDSADSAAETTASDSSTSEGSTDEAAAGEDELVIEDNSGEKTISLPVEKPVVTDNRAFELLHDWGVELAAAPIGLIPDTLSDKYNEDTIEFDLGSHREPDLEKVVAAAPDLIWNGQRFSQHGEDLEELAPDATLVDFTPRDGEPLDAELIRLTESLGQIFGHEDEAQAAIDDFNEALERAKEAYDPEKTVMAVNTSGGEINYIAPSVGRTWGPLFDLIGFTPSLEVEDGSSNHEGDDISVEAIAESNPDYLLVLDRDAAVSSDEPDYSPASDLIADSAALQNITAIQDDNVIIAPTDTYTNENIVTYTEILNLIADAFEAQN